MSHATLLFGQLQAAYPTANIFAVGAQALHASVYVPVGKSYITALRVCHYLFGAQTILLLAALGVRLWRRNDFWVFKLTQTARGTYITPHFAVAWQLTSLVFLIILQPYIVVTIDHTEGREHDGYLAWKHQVFLPAWFSTWFALWSLAVAVSLPRESKQGGKLRALLTSPTFVNAHFIGGGIVALALVCTPGIIAAIRYDEAIHYFEQGQQTLLSYAPSFPTMSTTDVQTALAGAVPSIDAFFVELHSFTLAFQVSWAAWFTVICYEYFAFVAIATTYFSFLRASMREVDQMSSEQNVKRANLKRSWWITVLTCLLVSAIGLTYAAASLFPSILPDKAIQDPVALQFETLLAIYGFGILGIFCGILSLAQVLQRNSYAPAHSDATSSKNKAATRLGIQVQTDTHVYTDHHHPAKDFVQVELNDAKTWNSDGKGVGFDHA